MLYTGYAAQAAADAGVLGTAPALFNVGFSVLLLAFRVATLALLLMRTTTMTTMAAAATATTTTRHHHRHRNSDKQQ